MVYLGIECGILFRTSIVKGKQKAAENTATSPNTRLPSVLLLLLVENGLMINTAPMKPNRIHILSNNFIFSDKSSQPKITAKIGFS